MDLKMSHSLIALMVVTLTIKSQLVCATDTVLPAPNDQLTTDGSDFSVINQSQSSSTSAGRTEEQRADDLRGSTDSSTSVNNQADSDADMKTVNKDHVTDHQADNDTDMNAVNTDHATDVREGSYVTSTRTRRGYIEH